MSNSVWIPDVSGVPELTLEETISRAWQVNSEGASALTPQERRAVELFVSRHYTGPWFRKKILKGGWEYCLEMVMVGPNSYGL